MAGKFDPKVHTHTHPVVRELFDRMWDRGISVLHMAQSVDLDPATLHKWRRGQAPTLHNLERCLNVVGLAVTVQSSAAGLSGVSDDQLKTEITRRMLIHDHVRVLGAEMFPGDMNP